MKENLNASDGARPADAASSRVDGASSARVEPFFVIGVGASAGGLEALSSLVSGLSLEHAAMVVVQHLSPDHDSLLGALLSRVTNVVVRTAVDGEALEPGRILVIPPNGELSIERGVLRVSVREATTGPRLPIDSFFRSLAADRGASAVGVVLSGTGTDGTEGLGAIKAAGGITFVQDPATAKYEGMPHSALARGVADFCLAPAEIARELSRLHERSIPEEPVVAFDSPGVEAHLANLFRMLHAKFGHDLACYKRATLERRITRRMALSKITRIEDYVALAETNAAELRALYDDLLIGVTRFFRDFDPAETFAETVFPRIVAGKSEVKPVRIWVPACSTGEEAYSIAIALLEYLESTSKTHVKVQIFATDVDEDSIQRARQGSYPASIASDVSPERLARFFVAKADGYHVGRRVRDMVIFSTQNVLRDAPFSRIDLVSCRNLLIYLQPAAQRKVLSVLHFALVAHGFLVLGASETFGDAADLFGVVDAKHCVFEKKSAAPGALHAAQSALPAESKARVVPTLPRAPSLQELADQKVIETFGPPGAIIDADLRILQFRGQLGPLLDPPPGAASLDLARIVRAELRTELRMLVGQALTEKRTTRGSAQLGEPAGARRVEVTVIPLGVDDAPVGNLVVLFDARPIVPPAGPAADEPGGAGAASAGDAHAQRAAELERELARARQYLDSALEERAAANQELTAANEELQSANEELQSTNEELETAREEMQATNEELNTVNEELQTRLGELSHINDDLFNVLAGVESAVIIVGMDLRIRRYTAAAERLLALGASDVGTSLDAVAGFFGSIDVRATARGVIDSMAAFESEVLAGNSRWYQLRITPYKTSNHQVQGAVITLLDVDVRKRSADALRNATAYATKFLSALDRPLVIVDEKLRVVWANDALCDVLQLAREEVVGAFLARLPRYRWDDPALARRLDDAIARGRKFRDFPLTARDGAGGTALEVAGARVPQGDGAPLLLLSLEPRAHTHHDVEEEGHHEP